MSSEKIEKWVQLALKNEDLLEYTINLGGNTNKDDGYLSNITFVTVTGKTKLGQPKTLSLVIKASKESDNLRGQVPLKEVFEKEIFIYDRVVVEFEKFQKEFGDGNFLNYMAKCYSTEIINGAEVLIMENLKLKGYTLWDRKQPMTYEHLRLTLEAYGRWHALSFALKSKKPAVFEKLKAENDINAFSYWISKIGMVDVLFKIYEKARCASTISVSEKKKAILTRDQVERALIYMFSEDAPEHAILHGDGWTNNFLFQMQKNDDKPKNVCILDFQMSCFASPVIDLSYFLYTCCDTAKYRNVQELLKIYHEAFSECLHYFGCDVPKVFSFEKLLYHWRKYSCYGIILGAFLLRFSLCDSDEAPDLAAAAEKGTKFVEIIDFPLKNEELYVQRMSDNFAHYVANLE